jgi:hypothetical protein
MALSPSTLHCVFGAGGVFRQPFSNPFASLQEYFQILHFLPRHR